MPLSASAVEAEDEAIIVDAAGGIEDLTTAEINDADLVKTDAEQLDSQEIEALKEVIDNGTDVFVEGSDLEVVAEELNDTLSEVENAGVLVGGYVSSDETGYRISSIYAQLVGNSVNDPIVKNQFKSIKADDFLDYKKLLLDFNDGKRRSLLKSRLSDEEIASLQASEFSDLQFVTGDSISVYWLMKPTKEWEELSDLVPSWGEDGPSMEKDRLYCLRTNNSYAGWTTLGSVTVSPVIRSAGTNSSGNYDIAQCFYELSVDSGIKAAVLKYEAEMNIISDKTKSAFVGYTKVNDSNGVISNGWASAGESFGVDISYAGNGVGVSGSIETPVPVTGYSYNEKSQDITNHGISGGSSIAWTAKPKKDSEGERYWNEAYHIKPSVAIRSAEGTETQIEFYVGDMSLFREHIQSHNYLGNYSAKVKLSFKDHKAV